MGDVITKLEIITRKTKFQELKDALNEIGVMGMTVTQVLGCGTQKGEMQYYRGVPMELKLLPKIKVEVVVCEVPVENVIEVCEKVAGVEINKEIRGRRAGDPAVLIASNKKAKDILGWDILYNNLYDIKRNMAIQGYDF